MSLKEVETRRVHVGLRGAGGICPGRPVALDLALDVAAPGSRETQRLLMARRELDDAIFDVGDLHLSSAQGAFQPGGVFLPSPDVTRSADSGFRILVRPPRGAAVGLRFPPAYDCTSAFGREGEPGAAGLDGADAVAAAEERAADGEMRPGSGASGGAGAQGRAGVHLTVWVTWARTPDHPQLILARRTGDAEGVTLVDATHALTVVASGGRGGAGGRGGSGARAPRQDQRGGEGGAGGPGGRGGDGGDVTVVIDERFPELERLVTVDVSGGMGGAGGLGGRGGAGFAEFVTTERDASESAAVGAVAIGAALAGARRTGSSTPAKKTVFVTSEPGPEGARGRTGLRGEAGTSRVRLGAVRGRFDGLGAIEPR